MLSRTNYSLTQLEYVLAVYKHGHFARAAEACNITQPTLSMQIQKLENDLGIVIFDRSKKPILLTDVGKRVIGQIQSTLSEARKIEGLINLKQSEKVEGHLTLGIIPTVAPYILPRLLPALEKSYPGIELRILELQTHRIIEALNNDEIDAGLLATPLKLSQIHEDALFYEPFSVLCRKDHELSDVKKVKYSSLKFDDLWLLEEGHCLRHQILDVCSLKKDKKNKRKYEFESGSLETLKSLVNAYGGYTLLPALAQNSLGSNSIVVPFERPIPARQIGIVYRREHYKRELIEALGETIVESIPEHVRKIREKDLDVLPIE
jgi:LysR family transcriptional regulator, hydrogen peroxide-inducible genes activator